MNEEAIEWIDKFDKGELDLDEITVGEWLRMSLLTMFAGAELHRDIPVFYKGGLYTTHLCVSFIRPGAAEQEDPQ